MGVVAVLLAIGALIAPSLAGAAFTMVLGAFLVAAGVSHVVYALHGRAWQVLAPELLVSLVNLAAGAFLLLHRDLAGVAGSVVIALALGLHGAVNVALALSSRPRTHWRGKLGAGLVMLACASVVALRWPVSGHRVLGEAVGASLLAGGLGTIWLQWKTRTDHDPAHPGVPAPPPPEPAGVV